MDMFIVPITKMPGVESFEKISGAGEEQGRVSGRKCERVLEDTMKQMEEAQEASNEADELLASGGIDDLHTAMIKAEQSTAAVEFTTQLTSRVVNAYNQIMNMQV